MGRKRQYENDNARKLAYKHRQAKERAKIVKQFVAIDGEGEDSDDEIRTVFTHHGTFVADDYEYETITHTHHYTMLTASNGTNHRNIESKSLSTVQCFDFLLSLPRYYANAIFVGFSFNYDVNMMLRDIDEATLTELWKKGYCIWGKYSISWIPSKIFRLAEYVRGKKKPIRTITVYDTFGFFQKSFVGTLSDWNVGTAEQVQAILTMKKQRGNFASISNESIAEYNTLECILLCELMNKLRQALETCDLHLHSWHGAGAVGNTLLEKHDIHKHIEDIPEHINNAVMCAYFGGRFQTLLLGEHNNAHSHDIRSAYPWAFLNLPSMANGTWVETNEYQDTPYSVYYIKWAIKRSKNNITPFPHRHKRKISYPTTGEGWYWYPEVSTAIKHYGKKIQVVRGYIFKPENEYKPFSFLNDMYEQRAKFKREKNDAQLVLKLGINSVYGKTAQGTIARDDRRSKPKFQNYFWAGYCTSIARAKVFDLAMRNPSQVIAFATDGVFSREKLTTEEEEVNQIGNWEHGEINYMFWAQSGVYFMCDDGTRKGIHTKTRGLGKREISFAKLRKQFRDRKLRAIAHDTVHIRRFMGLQYCLHVKHMHDWRKWVEVQKTLELWPNSNYVELEQTNEYVRFGQRDMQGIASEPYEAKTLYDEKGIDVEFDEAMSQPLYED